MGFFTACVVVPPVSARPTSGCTYVEVWEDGWNDRTRRRFGLLPGVYRESPKRVPSDDGFFIQFLLFGRLQVAISWAL